MMGTTDKVTQGILTRELAEVYLLLDHISGHSGKTLTTVLCDENHGVSIKDICQICWPPKGTAMEQAGQAQTLLLAKDRLNAAATPANGASIAFTLLVTGHDDIAAVQRKPARRSSSRLRRFWPAAESPPIPAPATRIDDGPLNSSADSGRTGDSSVPQQPHVEAVFQGGSGGDNATGNSASALSDLLDGQPPSRQALAKLAYPELFPQAAHFRRWYNGMVLLLLAWLFVTCLLSWHISSGHLILARLDSMAAARSTALDRIAAAAVLSRSGAAVTAVASVDVPSALLDVSSAPVGPKQDFANLLIMIRCTSYIPPMAGKRDASEHPAVPDDATALKLCSEYREIDDNVNSASEDIAAWLFPWRLLLKWQSPSHKDAISTHENSEAQWAAVVVEVLSTAVLPLFYAFLGAGAAVVRDIWGKMRDSLLSPRDLNLSLGRLALGAVIGACISLFMVPYGAGSQSSVGLIGSGTLTASALSFVAGFGVEGVFAMLESFIKRVFNTEPTKS